MKMNETIIYMLLGMLTMLLARIVDVFINGDPYLRGYGDGLRDGMQEVLDDLGRQREGEKE